MAIHVESLDPTDPSTAQRIVEIQLAAYAVEAELIGFWGIPQLGETADDVTRRVDLTWRGAIDDDTLAGIIAWSHDDEIDIDRLAVDPAFARRGHGRRLIRSVPDGDTVVSTGKQNAPAMALYTREGFSVTGEVEIADGVFLTQLHRPQR